MATGTTAAVQKRLHVFEIKTSQSINANSVVVVSTSAEKSGYRAIGVVGFYVNGLAKGTVRSCFLQANNEDGVSTQPVGNVVWEIFNANTSAQTANCRAHVLYEKI